MLRKRELILGLCLALLANLGETEASVVRRMDETALRTGADLVVEGTVTGLTTRWNSSHTGLETVTQISVSRTIQGVPTARIEIVEPGGNLNGAKHVVVGIPTFTAGEHARFYLKRQEQDAYHVYGWGQGVWRADTSSRGVRSFSPPNMSQNLGSDPDVLHFTHNGMKWQPEQLPVQYQINSAGSDDVAAGDSQTAIFAAFQTWQNVACSNLTFSYAGQTDLQLAADGINVISWIESDWIYGDEAAAATSLFFAPGMTPSADVAFNGVNFSWANSPLSAGTSIQDVQGVLTHELGHFSGLSHTQSSLDTMYFAWTPWQSQRSLSVDDKLGLCELYPQDGDECLAGACEDGALCQSYTRGTLCTPKPDSIGDPCDYNRVECDGFCLFTSTDLSTGYCSRFCEDDGDCPDRFACEAASSGGSPVRVCFTDDSRRVDAGPDAGCMSSADCESGFFCSASGSCGRECAEDFDCEDSHATCSLDGRCVDKSSEAGCGCNSGSGHTTGWTLFALFALLVVAYRRQKSANLT